MVTSLGGGEGVVVALTGEVVEEGAGLDMVDTMTQIMVEVIVCKRTGMVETI